MVVVLFSMLTIFKNSLELNYEILLNTEGSYVKVMNL
jgi:hypothetical protein